jgi:hypothetical protein
VPHAQRGHQRRERAEQGLDEEERKQQVHLAHEVGAAHARHVDAAVRDEDAIGELGGQVGPVPGAGRP